MKFVDIVCFLIIGFTIRTLSMLAIVILYFVLGAVIFVNLEAGQEIESRYHSLKVAEKAKGMVDVLRNNFSDTEIYDAFLQEHEKQKKKPYLDSLPWHQLFGDKVFFAFNLVTTVGYGEVSFKSKLSQAVSIIYTTFGIPLHVILMRLLSHKFRGGLRRALIVSQALCPTGKWILFPVGFLFFFAWSVVFIFLPAYFIAQTEDWHYDKGVYFSFVSFSTIGFGDFVAGISGDMEHVVYPLAVFLIVMCIVFGLGFTYMAFNMLALAMGIYLLDKLDGKSKERANAMKKLKPLLELIKDLNWQLVKSKPDNFHDSVEIEKFTRLMIEKPEDVTPEMLKRMFDVALNLKEACYEQLSKMQPTETPMTAVIERSEEDLPHVLRKHRTRVSYTAKDQAPPSVDSRHPSIEMKPKRGEDNSTIIDLMEEKNASVRKNQSKDRIPSITDDDDEENLRAKNEPSTSNIAKDDAESGLATAKPEDESATEKNRG